MTTSAPSTTARTPPAPRETVRQFAIEGMSCVSCVARVERALEKVPGVVSAAVNLATERADVRFSVEPDVDAVARAVKAAGYSIPTTSLDLKIEGMSCASCVARIEKALKAVPGVSSASVNLATEHASVRFARGAVESGDLVAAVEAAGYGARTLETEGHDPEPEIARDAAARQLRISLLFAAALTLPIVVLEMGRHLVPAVHEFVTMTLGMQRSWYLQVALATLVLFGPGLRFFQKGVPALLRAAPDMNSLVAIGTFAAWGYSTVATFAPGLLPQGTANVYYEAAAVIVSLILLGRYLEARAKGRTGEAIKRLIGLQPKTARVQRSGETLEVPLGEVRAGDIVIVRPGEKVAVDGTVVEGSS